MGNGISPTEVLCPKYLQGKISQDFPLPPLSCNSSRRTDIEVSGCGHKIKPVIQEPHQLGQQESKQYARFPSTQLKEKQMKKPDQLHYGSVQPGLLL